MTWLWEGVMLVGLFAFLGVLVRLYMKYCPPDEKGAPAASSLKSC